MTHTSDTPARDSAMRTYTEMKTANMHLADATALRAQMSRDGYLYFRDLLPASAIIETRSAILEVLARHGCIRDGADRDKAISVVMPFREGEDAFFKVYDEIVRLEAFYALAHHPDLTAVMRDVLGETAFPHPLSIVRLVFPENEEVTTPPHQDFPNNQGSQSLTATWIPLIECPAEMGGLGVLEGSHRFGVLPLKSHLGAGNRQAALPDAVSDLHWVSTDFHVGDVLMFGAMTVHAARVNLHPNRMRLSVDFRFQTEGDALTPICLQPHFERLTWPEVYRGWASDDLQYYWKDKSFTVAEFDGSLHDVSEDELQQNLVDTLHYNSKRKRRFKERVDRLSRDR